MAQNSSKMEVTMVETAAVVTVGLTALNQLAIMAISSSRKRLLKIIFTISPTLRSWFNFDKAKIGYLKDRLRFY